MRHELKDPFEEGKIPAEKRESFLQMMKEARSVYEGILVIEWANYDAREGGPLDHTAFARYGRMLRTWANTWRDIPADRKREITNRATTVPEIDALTFGERFEEILNELAGAADDFAQEYDKANANYSYSRLPSTKLLAKRSYRKDDERRDLAPLKAVAEVVGEWWTTEMGKGWPPDFPREGNRPRTAEDPAAKMFLAVAIELGSLDDRASRDHDEQDCLTAVGGAK